MDSPGTVTTLLQQARKRLFWILTLTQSAHAASAALFLLVLLLIVGTQVMDWYWPLLLFVTAMAFVIWRVSRAMPNPYRVAQIIDQRCQLPDTISTAVYFAGHAAAIDAPTIEVQQRQAEQALTSVQLPAVFPLSVPRSAYATAALVVVAGSLLAYRYGSMHELDLRRPLVALDLPVLTREQQVAQSEDPKKKQQHPLASDTYGVSLREANQPEQAPGTPPESPFKAVNAQDPNGISQTTDQGKKGQEIANNAQQQNNSGEQEGKGEKQQQQSGQQGNEQQAQSDSGVDQQQQGQQQAQQKGPQAGKQSNSPGNSSLMDKMRDAMANLMNKMQSPQKGNDQQQANKDSQNQQKGSQQQASNQKGTQTPGSPQSDSASAAQQQEAQSGESGEKSQMSQNKMGDKSSPQASPDSKSGVGAQDGEKGLKDAQQLEAMGKISELIGRRSANVQGEVTIEVSSGKQQLLTPYLQRRATHGEGGGDTNRDAIPLAYQQYVQQYFEQVHKEKPVRGRADAAGPRRGAAN